MDAALIINYIDFIKEKEKENNNINNVSSRENFIDDNNSIYFNKQT
jgi:hypothetical protein